MDPAESPSPAVGSDLTIRLKITNGRNVAGYDIGVIFDTSALRYVSGANGTYLPSGAFFAPPQVSGGRVTLTATSVSGAASATSGTLASVTFRVVSVKQSTLRLAGVILSDSNARSLTVQTRDGTVVQRRAASWDVNRDGRVNVLDLTSVARLLGTRNVAADTNGDGTVNVLDLVTVAQHLGETTGPTRPVTPPVVTPPVVTPLVASTEGMVLIPAGEFRMGSNSGRNDEKPVHSVYVDAFYMDKYEVTNAEYAVFLNTKGKHAEGGRTWLQIGSGAERIEYVAGKYRAKAGYENHPVVEVSWYGAMAYAEWKGKRLPTEAEWEYAARGSLSSLKYPWGNSIDSSRANYSRHVGDTTAVGKYTANGYGLYDVAGNVWEWCLDEYNGNFYSISSARNPLSGANSIQWLLDNYTGIKSDRVSRGGAWNVNESYARVAERQGLRPPHSYNPSNANLVVGFRCVRSVTP